MINYPDLPPPSSARQHAPLPVVSSREQQEAPGPAAARRPDNEPGPVASAPISSHNATPLNDDDVDATKVEDSGGVPDDDPDVLALLQQSNEDERFEREFYLQEDEGHFVQDGTSEQAMGHFLFTNDKIQAREVQKVSARQSALNDDQVAWEENRLVSAGTVRRGVLDQSMEQDTRVTLLVHQVKPPFLDGRVAFSTIREAVPTVRDASSDFAKLARAGSTTLRTIRAKRDKNAMRNKFWELGGTRMGNAMKVQEVKEKTVDDLATTTDNGEIDYKKTSGFATHMKKDTAVSNFARTKTIRQQREFLPVYSVRNELLNVIRENNVVVIVGETGTLRFDTLCC
jgi:pre-mRNA-splicing factor ATP-dependent RNA helicase DHX38/PRP16